MRKPKQRSPLLQLPPPAYNLLVLRARRGITQSDVAQATGLDEGNVCKMERGGLPISAESALALSGLFEVPVELFYANPRMELPKQGRPRKRPVEPAQ